MLLLRLSHSATLFPYTTLFRSEFLKKAIERKYLVFGTTVVLLILSVYGTKFINSELAPETEADEISINFYLRSEEHTSELQSRGHLVCRLLLENKKNKTIVLTI